MGDPALICRKKLESALHEAETHLRRIDTACALLGGTYKFPLSNKDFHELLRNDEHLALADQMIFRFSKAQDCIGAKLFKSFLLAQGENIDKPIRMSSRGSSHYSAAGHREPADQNSE